MLPLLRQKKDVSHLMTLTTGGYYWRVPASPPDFGHSYNPEAVIEHHAQFDFYDGGGIDIAFLGMAQADKDGNVNVTKFVIVLSVAAALSISVKTAAKLFTVELYAGGLKVEVKEES